MCISTSLDFFSEDDFVGSFEIPFKVMSLNEITFQNRQNRYGGNRVKSEIESRIIHEIKLSKMPEVKGACVVVIYWAEANKMRDLDNIYSGAKFILDAMKRARVIIDDSQRYVIDLINIRPVIGKGLHTVVEVYSVSEKKKEAYYKSIDKRKAR